MADWIAYSYAAAVTAGGVMGYVKKGSIMSGIMGLTFGSLAGYGAYQTSEDPAKYYLRLLESIINRFGFIEIYIDKIKNLPVAGNNVFVSYFFNFLWSQFLNFSPFLWLILKFFPIFPHYKSIGNSFVSSADRVCSSQPKTFSIYPKIMIYILATFLHTDPFLVFGKKMVKKLSRFLWLKNSMGFRF